MAGTSTPELCDICHLRPKFVGRDGAVHPYCGRTCAKEAPKVCALAGCNDRADESGFCCERHERKARHWNPCKHPNCADWAIIDGYCSLAHLREATEYRPCKTCKKNRRAMGRDYCSRTCDDFATGRTMARLDEIEFKDFRTVAQYTVERWKDPNKEAPRIGRVFKVIRSPLLEKQNEKYRKTLGSRPSEEHTFYSGQCICDLGTRSLVEPCQIKSCGICMPLKSGYSKLEFEYVKHEGPFGPAIYTEKNPSVADQSAISTTTSAYRVMIINTVTFNATGGKMTDKGTLAVLDSAAVSPEYVILYDFPTKNSDTKNSDKDRGN